MKKILLLIAAIILSAGSMFAYPRIKSITSSGKKTKIEVIIPADMRNDKGGMSIENIRIISDDNTISPKNVNADFKPDVLMTVEFKEKFNIGDSRLVMNINGKDVEVFLGDNSMNKLIMP